MRAVHFQPVNHGSLPSMPVPSCDRVSLSRLRVAAGNPQLAAWSNGCCHVSKSAHGAFHSDPWAHVHESSVDIQTVGPLDGNGYPHHLRASEECVRLASHTLGSTMKRCQQSHRATPVRWCPTSEAHACRSAAFHVCPDSRPSDSCGESLAVAVAG